VISSEQGPKSKKVCEITVQDLRDSPAPLAARMNLLHLRILENSLNPGLPVRHLAIMSFGGTPFPA
jgi:hypothetical protein